MNRMRCRSSDGATWTVSARGNRAITHRLWVKTAQVTVRCRLANPLARRGRPKKRFLKIPIRPSVCARRVWAAANCSSWSRCCRLSGERGGRSRCGCPVLPGGCGWPHCQNPGPPYGDQVAELLHPLPKGGLLFPRLAQMHEKHRAREFRRRCTGLGINGVTLHSYRYA